MRKVKYILKQMFILIQRRNIKILIPVFIILAFLAILVYYVGPAVIVSFIYAGI
jgi:hypothetical protein